MRFRELYQADYTAIEPRPELLAATRALYAQHAQAKPQLKWRIPAPALGMAACLLLAVGLCLGLPGSTGGDAQNTAPMSRSTAEDRSAAKQDIQVAAYEDEIEAIPEKSAALEDAQSYMTAAPLTDATEADWSKLRSLPPASYFAARYFAGGYPKVENAQNRITTASLTGAIEMDTNKLCAYPLFNGEYEKEYAADCVNWGDSAIRPTFALKLLQPARNHAVYLIRCGLWLTEYNISTTIYLY